MRFRKSTISRASNFGLWFIRCASGAFFESAKRSAFVLVLALTGICCAEARTIRVMSYNIHVGFGMDKKLDLARIAAVIKRERADIVGLQEVDRGVERTGRVDQIAELARLTGMDYAFAPNLRYQGGWYGVAILSRFPITNFEHRRYRNRREAERRGFIRAEIPIDDLRLQFVTTHLDYQFADGRLFEAEQLLRALDPIRDPLIVAGDFNDEPTGQTYAIMRAALADAWVAGRNASVNGFTFPADEPVKRIDYIFYRGSDRLRIGRAWVVETLASDHRPVVVEFELH